LEHFISKFCPLDQVTQAMIHNKPKFKLSVQITDSQKLDDENEYINSVLWGSISVNQKILTVESPARLRITSSMFLTGQCPAEPYPIWGNSGKEVQSFTQCRQKTP
jgi:hypothetical protein